MEWLMGKARGMGRGLIASGQLSSGQSPPAFSTSSGTLSPSAPDFLDESNVNRILTLPGDVLYEDIVQCLPCIDQNELIANNVIGLFENVCAIYEAIYESCKCSTMIGLSHILLSLTNERGKKVKCTARQYIDSLLLQCDELINNRALFPTQQNVGFSSDFINKVTLICNNILHTLTHIYYAHFDSIKAIGMVEHLNSLAKHFFIFTDKYIYDGDRDSPCLLAELKSALLGNQSSLLSSSADKSETDQSNIMPSPAVNILTEQKSFKVSPTG